MPARTPACSRSSGSSWASRVYRRGAIVRAKGAGKSPLAAAIAIEELTGPLAFAGWDAAAEPIGQPVIDPLVQIGALSEEQADSNVVSLIFTLLTANDGRAAQGLGVDVGRSRLYLHGRPGKCEAVTASASARDGQRVSFGLLD